MTLKENKDCYRKEVKIIGCEESIIYIDACVKFVSILNCVNCTIYVSAVSRVTTIDKCEKIKVTIVSIVTRKLLAHSTIWRGGKEREYA